MDIFDIEKNLVLRTYNNLPQQAFNLFKRRHAKRYNATPIISKDREEDYAGNIGNCSPNETLLRTKR